MSATACVRFDFADRAAITALYPMLERMRREDPVHRSPQLNGWVLTRYADAVAALRNPALCSAERLPRLVRDQLGEHRAIAGDFERVGRDMMLFRDGADHHRVRVLGNRGFTPSALDRAQPVVERVVNELLDAARPRGRMDVVEEFAKPLPAIVIAELFGIPPDDRGQFQRWAADSARFFGGTFGDPVTDARAANAGTLELERYFLKLIEERGARPGHDLLSLLLAGQADGKLSAAEVTAQCVLILNAGHLTTTDMMGNAVHALLGHPDQWRALRADPSRAPAAVEEALRYDTSIPFIRRIARADTEVAGRPVRAGEAVYVGLAAANRDPAVFPDPDAFDLARAGADHLSFAVGPHICLGAGLARRELAAGLAALARRMPDLRFAAEPPVRRCENLIFRGFHSLPVEF